MRFIVTGGAGFVGSNIVARLQRDHPDAEILVTDDFRSGSFKNLSREIDGTSQPDPHMEGFSFRGEIIARPLHELDLYELIEEFDPDVVFHEASITDTTVTDEAKMIAENVEPFGELIDLAISRGFKLVWASSAATYGTRAHGATAEKRPFKLEDAGKPANVYGFSKWVMENMHRRAMLHAPDAHIVGVRYFNVFGPNEYHKAHMASMIYQLAQKMLDGTPPRIFHDGEQARDHVYVEDIVEGTIAAAAPNAASGIYNLGSGVATSFNQIVTALNEAFGTDYAPEYFDNPYTFYQDYTCADLTQTKAGLRWSPRYKPHDAIVSYAKRLKRLKEAGA